DPNLQGQAVTSIRTYLSEVHGTFLQTLINLMNDYSASLLLYKDGYYNIDSNNHAELPENTFTTLQSDLKTSRDHLKSQIELLNTARSKISDLVSYSGSSHAKTIQHYNFIINDIKTLDESIKQYESNHASHDLSAFKELLASTKALLAEYSNRPRTVATYQSGDIGRLTNIERFATAYQAVGNHLTNNAERLQAAQERDQARFEALAAEERSKQGWIDLALGAVTIAVGLAAIVATAGAATPLVVGAGIVAGTGTVAYGASNVAEAGQDIYLGYKGDGKTLAINPIRDTLFMGNDKLYHQVGGLFTTTSAVMIPIGQTQSVTKGLAEFAIGEVGGFVGGQAGYHGTKLLGGSEADAQRATFVGSILGGFAASSAASKFSLNEVEVPNTPTYNREQILKNIEESRIARKSSKMDDYLRKEYELQGKYFAERIVWKNGKYAYISSDIDKATGQLTPVRYRSYLKADGSIDWPLYNGFTLKDGKPVMQSAALKAGDIIDRFGESGGTFTSPIENGKITPFNQRGLPYPEGYQRYYQYKVIQDINLENVTAAYSNLSQIDKVVLDRLMKDYKFTLADMADPQKGTIDIVFGAGGGTQIKFGTSVNWYEKMGLIKEIK
ncbi:glycohydrolase toxin TNT-related protein, partial [Streptococcus suis]|nr:glycohydrolase toxin TNT-related protein [Streptococcus suis]